MNHSTTPEFWDFFKELPEDIQTLARKNFALLKEDPRHPSLRFKKAGPFWSARAGRNFRALAREDNGRFAWFWIGPHSDYEKYLRG